MTGIRPRLLWGLRGPGSTTGSSLAQRFQLSALLVPPLRWECVCRTDKRGRPGRPARVPVGTEEPSPAAIFIFLRKHPSSSYVGWQCNPLSIASSGTGTPL